MSEYGGPPVKIIKAKQQEDLDVWSLPDVQEKNAPKDDDKTNAFGKKKGWRYEPPEEKPPEPEPLTAQEIEEIRQAAHDEGFNQGKEEGYSQGYDEGKLQGIEAGKVQGIEEGNALGLEQGKEVINEQSKVWQQLISQLHSPLSTVERNVEEQLLALVVQLTEAVVLQEAKTNPDILTAAISQGIKSLPSQEAQTQIYLNPDDIKLVEEAFGETYITEQGWRLLAAPQFSQGSCQIENSTSNIDLQMKSRLKQVLESFLQDALHQ